MKILCAIFGKGWVTDYVNGNDYCVWRYTEVSTTDQHSWWVTIAVVGIFLFIMLVIGHMHEAAQVVKSASALIPYEPPQDTLIVDERINFQPGDRIIVTDSKGQRIGTASKDVEIAKQKRR